MPKRKVILINKMLRSSGIVLFREKEGRREYLLLRYTTIDRYWGLTKGTIEEGASEKDSKSNEITGGAVGVGGWIKDHKGWTTAIIILVVIAIALAILASRRQKPDYAMN